MITESTRISELTVAELRVLIQQTMRSEIKPNSKERAYGIPGIAQLFGVSYSMAKKIKASGAIDAAIIQRGRTIIVDAEEALKLWKGRTSKN